MKIIRRGVLPTEITYCNTCRECGTVYSFNISEVKTASDRNETWYYCRCPLCDKTNSFTKLNKLNSNIDQYL